VTTRGEDVLAWLEAAITKAEAEADRWHDAECSWHDTTILDLTVLQGGATLCDCDGPASVRRRCAAERKLLELHRPQPDGSGFPDGMQCRTCSQDGGDGYQYLVPAPCPTIFVLAEGYGWTGGER
jgi:hypothetical protein